MTKKTLRANSLWEVWSTSNRNKTLKMLLFTNEKLALKIPILYLPIFQEILLESWVNLIGYISYIEYWINNLHNCVCIAYPILVYRY